MSDLTPDIPERVIRVPKRGRPKVSGRNQTLRRKHHLYPEEQPLNSMSDQKNDIFIGTTDADDFIRNTFLMQRQKDGLSTSADSFDIHATKKNWTQYVRDNMMNVAQLFSTGDSRGRLFFESEESCVEYYIHTHHVSVTLMGDDDFVRSMREIILAKFDEVENHIEWIYDGNGRSIVIPLQRDRMPVDEMYPFLDMPLTEYYDDFMDSNASILLLIGPPGTGKTTFIRGLLQHTKSSAIVSYDPNVLEKDHVFADFIEGDNDVMVLEDADMFLKSRKESNTMMHKFLNVGDGLVTTKGKKLVFSTNLPSINDVDDALIRPGRCYDILHFDSMTQEDAELLAKKFGVELTTKKSRWTIAEIFNQETESKGPLGKTVNTKMGFV